MIPLHYYGWPRCCSGPVGRNVPSIKLETPKMKSSLEREAWCLHTNRETNPKMKARVGLGTSQMMCRKSPFSSHIFYVT